MEKQKHQSRQNSSVTGGKIFCSSSRDNLAFSSFSRNWSTNESSILANFLLRSSGSQMWDEARAREEGKEAENNANLVQHNILERKTKETQKNKQMRKIKKQWARIMITPCAEKIK